MTTQATADLVAEVQTVLRIGLVSHRAAKQLRAARGGTTCCI
ncbi:MAG TPA: hypothetical protein VL749_12560 [Patescibacteria group bacterium]|nr:hypothetical protein [Patescibacteria group bacterium]